MSTLNVNTIKPATGTEVTVSASLNVVNELTASADAIILDDKKFYFGTQKDAYIKYDEAGSNSLIISGGLEGGVEISGSMLLFQAEANRQVVFNNLGRDVNFSVGTDTSPHAIYADGGTDRVGIGRAGGTVTSTPTIPIGTLEVENANDAGVSLLVLTNTDVDQAALQINSAANTTAPVVEITASSLTTGDGINVFSNSNSTAARSLISVTNGNTAAVSASCITTNQAGKRNAPGILNRGTYISNITGTFKTQSLGYVLSTAEVFDAAFYAVGRNPSQADTTPTAAQFVSNIPNCQGGDAWDFAYYNIQTGSNAVTLTGSAGIRNAIGGDAEFSIPANKGRLFKFVVFNNSGGSEDVRLVPLSDTFNILS